MLNLFLSASLVAGLLLMNTENRILYAFTTTIMIAAVFMILIVIYELDTMKVAEDEVSNEPYWQIIQGIEADG